ncbi:hypothetical protein FWK35_00029853 [Aphis craccivora]|uniref:Uncharacterized protein n=1 Tax=Aphis craccivora TaxID=307492 RepID=A0A6G0VQK1_APHCR|nr:hypothetical protein FWK35_00029853 [Aphis craccivora]
MYFQYRLTAILSIYQKPYIKFSDFLTYQIKFY